MIDWISEIIGWALSDEGIRAVAALGVAIWGLFRSRKSRRERIRDVAHTVFDVVEELARAGKLKTSTEKWTCFLDLFNKAVKAEGLGRTTKRDISFVENLVSQTAILYKRPLGGGES
ncbi:MAG: hypothetical protein R3322_00235 [Kiloniellales bacterium]|nr:hypothetical protein [Kiloniellales bacterium]